jgi:hypothetical protein
MTMKGLAVSSVTFWPAQHIKGCHAVSLVNLSAGISQQPWPMDSRVGELSCTISNVTDAPVGKPKAAMVTCLSIVKFTSDTPVIDAWLNSTVGCM